MASNFDEMIDRRNTASLKWDVEENELRMWVAGMDFATAPCVLEAMKKRLNHGIFGYTVIPEQWYEAYVGWWKKRHHFEMEKDWLVFCTGVVPAISSIVRKLTTPAEKVLIQTPVYNIFFNSILNNGCQVLESPLVLEDGNYRVDFEDLEQKLADPQTTLMILCNPHNPGGKIWDRATLSRIGELCQKYHVIVVSDEIHCDLTAPGREYVPFASVNETCRNISVTCLAPTKTFNLAGLQTAAVYVENKVLHHKMWRRLNTDEVAEPNAFAVCATIAAFTYGEDWLDQLREDIEGNKQYVTAFIEREIPQVKVVKSEATYLMWLDISALTTDSDAMYEFIRKDSGLYLASGREYGTNGDGFLRLNVATNRANVEDGMHRLKKSVEDFVRQR